MVVTSYKYFSISRLITKVILFFLFGNGNGNTWKDQELIVLGMCFFLYKLLMRWKLKVWGGWMVVVVGWSDPGKTKLIYGNGHCNTSL